MLKLAVAILLCSVAACMFVGGWTETDVNGELVLKAATHAAEKISNQSNSPYHLKLNKVLKARSQVVAGVNFDLKILIGQTQCEKDTDYADIVSCEFQTHPKTYHFCDIKVFRGLDGEHVLQSSHCYPQV